ncbi:hypothetical protein HAZT_HAZT004944 [Hyalella azteca]|uniref:Spondin domain-containing protein n=1 Tax=Hyalella azteca TaxID=294128 RepID=A0A6A0GW95_HYAAZ|nr:hypothetical protein HAZT_HAZT004944 [Hyalella azteca]
MCGLATTTEGVTHSAQHQVFREGQVASQQLKEFAETGRSDSLDAVTYASQGPSVLDAFYAPAIQEGVGETRAKFFADGNHSLVSVVAKIVPSPDWFVGVDSLDLCVAGHWLNATSLELSPLDAGTDQGLAFTSPSWQLTPADVIKRITNTSPSHPASSFAYPEKPTLPTMASVSIVKIREYRLVKPTAVTIPLRAIDATSSTEETTTSTTTTSTTTAGQTTMHEIDHNYIPSGLHAANSVRQQAQKPRQTPPPPILPTPVRRHKSVDGGTVGAEVRHVVHSISNSGETLPEITTNLSHALRSQEVPSRDPPYVTSNEIHFNSDRPNNSSTTHAGPSLEFGVAKLPGASPLLTNGAISPESQHFADDSNLISNDVAVLTNKVDEVENYGRDGGNIATTRAVPLNAVLPREQYDRLQQERNRQAIENHQKHQQLLQEKRRKLKEKNRKHRERKSSSLHIIPRGDAMSVIDSIVETYQRDQRRKRRQQRRLERRNRRKLERLNGIQPHRSKQAVDCKVGEWSGWSACSKTCGIGEQVRSRNVTQEPRRGGLKCPSLTETTWCGSARDCPRDYFRW